MAIIDLWTFTPVEQKKQEAVAWFRRNVEQHTQKGIKSRILAPLNGETGKLWTENEYDSLAAMQEYIASFFASDAWTKDLKKDLPGLFVHSAMVRHQYNIVE